MKSFTCGDCSEYDFTIERCHYYDAVYPDDLACDYFSLIYDDYISSNEDDGYPD